LPGEGLKDFLISNVSAGSITLFRGQHVDPRLLVEWACPKGITEIAVGFHVQDDCEVNNCNKLNFLLVIK
jgi:hypothetical protein